MAKKTKPETAEPLTTAYALNQDQVILVQDILRHHRNGLLASRAPDAVIAQVTDLQVCFTWPDAAAEPKPSDNGE